ncbi:hypothetical protein GCM10011585_27460 [Edaphobacter dinghuensis]|uniref:Uncharacterized protein n=1 Tax=Edaphobacter dinghuensis TaxID=1560005 RepID=A0A917M8Q6_9BACT|nr:hypothetical protein GCM10011585_27460 [Edaphobacter dinghuensis]
MLERHTLYRGRLRLHAPARSAVRLRHYKHNLMTGGDNGFKGRDGELRSAAKD